MIGAGVNFARGVYERHKLEKQAKQLEEMSREDVHTLTPSSAASVVKARLKAIEHAVSEMKDNPELVGIVDQIRKEAMEKMLTLAGGKPATEAQHIRMLHMLSDYSETIEESMAKLRADSEARETALRNKLAACETQVSSTRSEMCQAKAEAAQRERALTTRLQETERKLQMVQQQSASATERLDENVQTRILHLHRLGRKLAYVFGTGLLLNAAALVWQIMR